MIIKFEKKVSTFLINCHFLLTGLICMKGWFLFVQILMLWDCRTSRPPSQSQISVFLKRRRRKKKIEPWVETKGLKWHCTNVHLSPVGMSLGCQQWAVKRHPKNSHSGFSVNVFWTTHKDTEIIIYFFRLFCSVRQSWRTFWDRMRLETVCRLLSTNSLQCTP